MNGATLPQQAFHGVVLRLKKHSSNFTFTVTFCINIKLRAEHTTDTRQTNRMEGLTAQSVVKMMNYTEM
jgi:hypothetical protein